VPWVEPKVIVPVRETVAAPEPPEAAPVEPPARPRAKATPARAAEPPGFSAYEPANARDLPSDSEPPTPAPAEPKWVTPEPKPPHPQWVPPELIPTEPAWVTPMAAVPPRPAAKLHPSHPAAKPRPPQPAAKPRPPQPIPPAPPASPTMTVAAAQFPPAPGPVPAAVPAYQVDPPARARAAVPVREEPRAGARSAGPGTWVLGAAVAVLALTLGFLLFLGFSRQDGSFSIGRWQVTVRPASAPGPAPAPSEDAPPRDTLASPKAADSPAQEAPAGETEPDPTAPAPRARAKPAASSTGDRPVRAPGVLGPAPAPAGVELGVLCGTVRDSEGRPVTRAQVMMADAGLVVLTDRSGRFCLTVPTGERTLSVVALGFTSERLLIIVSKRTPELTVTLQATAPYPVKP